MNRFPSSDTDAFRTLARAWAATVNVVTVKQKPGAVVEGVHEIDAFTATAFLTVSIEPPIVLVACTNGASSLAMLRDAAAFAVNLLAPEQDAVANAFARPHADRPTAWNEVAWVPDADGVPLLGGTIGAFSARVRQLVDAGDHTLVLGDVSAIHLNQQGAAETLVYHNRGYGRFARAKT